MEDTKELKIDSKSKINEIDAIQRSRDIIPKTRTEIKDLVEPPLVSACELLWDLNVRTLSSSANKNDVGRNAYINIDLDSLSDENKQIATENGYLDKDEFNNSFYVQISLPLNSAITTEQITSSFDEMASKFKKQKATWIPSYTLQELSEIYGYEKQEQISPDVFIEEGLFYDKPGGKFYLSKEHFDKATDNN